ncbi:degenerate transposase [Streptococcus pneumoniae]|nr:degenerate transposase [Streptococcus pneumoniae]
MEKCYTDVTEFAIPASTQEQVQTMLEQAFTEKYYENTILHSDQGWQYRHDSYHRFLRVREFKHLCHARETAKTTV